MIFLQALTELVRRKARPDRRHPPASSDTDDPWADLEQTLRESRAVHRESMRKVDEARRRLRELGRNPPRGI